MLGVVLWCEGFDFCQVQQTGQLKGRHRYHHFDSEKNGQLQQKGKETHMFLINGVVWLNRS